MKRLLIATDEQTRGLTDDDRPLVDALKVHDIDARPVVWHDEGSWTADGVLVRSVWDYHLRCDEFLHWADRVASETTVLNSAQAIRWNSHKGYLDELAAKGIAIIDTLWSEPDDDLILYETMSDSGWDEVVVKPAVSADSHRTMRASLSDALTLQAAQDLIDDSAVAMMIQRYEPEFAQGKETSLVYFGGEYSHSVRRNSVIEHGYANAMDWRHSWQPSSELRAFADAVIAAAPLSCVARVDVLDGHRLLLGELELIEPNLMLSFAPDDSAYEMLAAEVARQLA